MPTYDYRCDACGHEFEEFQSITAESLRKCPACGKRKLQRLIGAGAGVIFKGSGFYQTDYRSDSYKKAAEADKSAGKAASDASNSAGSKSDGKSDVSKSSDGKGDATKSSDGKGDTMKSSDGRGDSAKSSDGKSDSAKSSNGGRSESKNADTSTADKRAKTEKKPARKAERKAG